MRKTVAGLIMDYFRKFDKSEHCISTVLDKVSKQHVKMYGKKPYDMIKVFATLVEEGKLTMVRDGVYRYDPEINVPHNE
ncbi:MAG: hypothetical protein BWY26_01055 [Elusimicrobia bacterium ADurb.Bin231]|nr:MAG: hypothetical protein BWY26_01055 [Elusimicrobia bacterium ADurb.Bin231]